MKTSRFNLVTTYDKTGETLLFNTLTGAFAAVNPDTYERVKRLFENPSWAASEVELTDFLANRGFLVDDAVDEHAVVLERSSLGISDQNRLDVILMPNMNCNFACTYCYESHGKSEMSHETKAALIAWLEQMVPRFKVVLLSWFGGEALLSYDTLIEIQRLVRNLCAQSNVRFSCHLTTNGYLLTAARAAELLSLDCYSYQITIDGVPEIQNSMRPLRGGGATFDRILGNLCGLVRMDRSVNVKLRINYNDTNLDRVPELLMQIPDDVRPQLDVVLERIFGEDFGNHTDSMPARRVGTTVERLYEQARHMGFSVTMNPLQATRLTYCYADRKNEFLINYNGDVFKCTVDRFESKDRLGWLQQDGTLAWEQNRLALWQDVSAFEDKCYSCTFMPMCMGGCRKVRWREGSVGADCTLPFMGFDKRLQYRYAQERGDDLVESSYRSPAGPHVSLNSVFPIVGQQ
jgi:uncharacterized protein